MPIPSPVKIALAPGAFPSPAASAARISATAPGEAWSRSSAEAPAVRTAAHAVPSGYLRIPCSLTIKALRSGIIMRMPRRPPSTETRRTRVSSRSKPRIMIAGIVTPTPKASDSPAEPAVWVMLFSRIVASRMPSFESMRKSAREMTATGIEALTVRPTFSTRYSDDIPKIIPRKVPMIRARTVNSFITVSGRMKGSSLGLASLGVSMRKIILAESAS